MVFVNVGKKNSSKIKENLIAGIQPHEFSSLKNIESPIQGQINELWEYIEKLETNHAAQIESLKNELEEKSTFIMQEFNIANDRINAGETPIYNSKDRLHAVINKDFIVEKIIIWNEESTYTPDLKCFVVEVDSSVKVGMIYKDKRFFKNNFFTKIYFFFKGIK